jgi:hypothetical protein
MPVFYVSAKERYRADAATALSQLNTYISNKGGVKIDENVWSEMDRELEERMRRMAIAEKPREDGHITIAFLTASLRDAVPKDSLYIIEAVTLTGEHSFLLSLFQMIIEWGLTAKQSLRTGPSQAHLTGELSKLRCRWM